MGYQKPLDVLFTEYQGIGIDDFINGSSYDDLKENISSTQGFMLGMGIKLEL